jgi:HlyD family secretion protein
MPAFLKNKWLWIGLALIVVLIVGFMLFSQASAAKKAELEKAAAQKVESPYAAIANGKADVEGGVIAVAARRGGVVRDVYVNEGDRVVAGQILARQEDDELRLAVQSAQAAVAESRSQLGMTEVELTAARREYERLSKLSSTNFVAAQRLDQARDTIASAEARLSSQRSAIQTAEARLAEARYNQELTVIRAPMDGRIARRYAQPGAGASTLNVTAMFDLEPDTDRIVRAEIVEADIPNVTTGQEVELTPEGDPTKITVGKVLRRAAVFGARKLQSDDPSARTDERVIEVVVSADAADFLIGQRVLVKFMKPGEKAGAPRPVQAGVEPGQAMRSGGQG